MKSAKNLTDYRHPIGVVSVRTGIPQDLLRAWEKRYRAVVPQRGETGRRLYCDQDIDRLRLLKRLVAGGRRISDVAALPVEDLTALVQEDQVESAGAHAPPADVVAHPWPADVATHPRSADVATHARPVDVVAHARPADVAAQARPAGAGSPAHSADTRSRAGTGSRARSAMEQAAAAGKPGKGGHLDEALAALENLDKSRLEEVLADAAVELSTPVLRRQVITPLLHAIGDRWQEGTLRIVHEHLASAIVRSFMAGIAKGNSRSPSAPRMLVTTPAGQRHELGALLAATVAVEQGWDVYYLGPDLPAEEIAAAVRQLNPKAVALSVVYQDGSYQLQEELRKLRRYLDPEIAIIVGGRAVSVLRPLLDETGVTTVEDLAALQDVLLTLNT